MKEIKLKSKSINDSFYQFICDDLVIGYLRRNSINQWTIFPELPNFKAMTICKSMDEGILLMKEKLNELIDKIS